MLGTNKATAKIQAPLFRHVDKETLDRGRVIIYNVLLQNFFTLKNANVKFIFTHVDAYKTIIFHTFVFNKSREKGF